MSCNCKKKIEIEEKYGEREITSLLSQAARKMAGALTIILFVAIAIVMTPIIIILIIYAVIFRKDNDVILPKFMRKYMKK